jgi:hypothetical protein
MSEKIRLVLASFLMLFVELMLIRWTSSNIYSLFFFTNFVLIASFLGIGVGFLRANESRSLFPWSSILLSLVVLFSYLCSYEYQAKLNPITGNLDYVSKLFKSHAYPVLLTLPLVFIFVTATMASIANAVAQSFKTFPALQAYRLEVLGTLAGIIIFSGLAVFAMSPIVWGVVITVSYATLYWQVWREKFSLLMILQVLSFVVMIGVFYKESTNTNHTWSTYYKIDVQAYAPESYVVNVNGLAQQVIESVEQRKKIKPFYFKPYEHMAKKGSLDNVLVIGAGTGGDVAIALEQGAKHVDAIEIDAKLYALGKKLNPNLPYNDPRVSVHINDGRAFLQKSKQRYDLIIYALTDSLMLIPGQSSMRLENYLYTQEGLEVAAKHLKPEGIFTIYNYYGQRWFADRMANTLHEVYRHAPCFDTYTADDYWATVLTISQSDSALQCDVRWKSSGLKSELPATDNHPFIYLQENTLTPMYVVALLFILFLGYFTMRKMHGSMQAIRQHFDLFLMGAAFLLLETKSVVSYALLFGTTWMVNSLVFISIMVSVYLAIEVAARTRKLNIYILYSLLIASLIVSWFVPASFLLTLSPVLRFIMASVITFSPIFIANLIFADQLRAASLSTKAMGVNLIGAVVGGLFEYGSLLVGYQHFPLIILAMYSLAFIWVGMVQRKI